jgi:hypothetical protein
LGRHGFVLSVICERRNIECPDLDTFNLWFFGIQQLAPLSHKFLQESGELEKSFVQDSAVISGLRDAE